MAYSKPLPRLINPNVETTVRPVDPNRALSGSLGRNGTSGDAVVDDVQFSRVDSVCVRQQAFAGLGMHDDRIGAFADSPRDGVVRGARFGKHGMQRNHHGFADRLDEIEEPCAVRAAEQSVFVLDVEHVGGMRVDVAREPRIRRPIVLPKKRDDACAVRVRFTARLVDRHNFAARTECVVETFHHVPRKRRNPAFARRIRSQE